MAGKKKFPRLSLPARLRFFFRNVPSYVWGAFAVLGILTFGVMLGYEMGVAAQIEEKEEFSREYNGKLMDLIDGYEKLSDLYLLQGQDVSVVLDPEILFNYPAEADEAFDSIDYYRDEILVQYGRILEMRRASGLPESTEVRSN